MVASNGYLIWRIRNDYESGCFVYPKTETIYHIDKSIKLKNPDTGEWHKAVLYTDNVKKESYAREYDDFLDKFIPLKEWREKEKTK